MTSYWDKQRETFALSLGDAFIVREMTSHEAGGITPVPKPTSVDVKTFSAKFARIYSRAWFYFEPLHFVTDYPESSPFLGDTTTKTRFSGHVTFVAH